MRKIWRAYVRRQRGSILAYLGMTAIFGLVFYLSDVPADPVFYAASLSGVMLLVYMAFDFAKYASGYRALSELAGHEEMDLDSLPETADGVEEEYRLLLGRMDSQYRELESQSAIRYQEMTDYYTLWAHQIKTPIAAMRLLIQTKETDVRALGAELFKIEQYVEMALSYLRVGNIASDSRFERCRMEEIVRQAVKKYSTLFILKKIKLELHPLEAVILTDERWAQFVVEQILSNALKYTRAGTISIYAGESGERLIIEDTGIGICPEDLPRVTEKGFTGYNGREDKKSTGIGLYLCRQVVDRLGHEMYISSEVGRGTRVELDFHRNVLEVSD